MKSTEVPVLEQAKQEAQQRLNEIEEFLEKVRRETEQSRDSPDPAAALRAVSRLLADRIDEGQYEQMKKSLPAEIQACLAK